MSLATLADACTSMSSTIAQKDLVSHKGQYPIYGASGLIGFVNFYKQERQYIAVVKDGAGIGRIFSLPPYSSVIGTMQYLLPKDNIDVTYLYYAMQFMHLEKYYTGSTIPHIYFKDYKSEPLNIPSIDKQQEIANTLRLVDEAIDTLHTQTTRLDDLVKSRFIELFGDPVTNTKNYPVYKLSDIATSRLGKMLDKKRQTGEHKYPYLANYNVQWFRFLLDNLNEMDFDEADRKEFELRKGDLLVCEGGEVGRCAVWKGEKTNCYYQKALHRVRCDTSRIIPEYLGYTFYQHSKYNGFQDAISGASTIAHLPGENLKRLRIIVPPLALQNEFAAFVEQADKSKLVIQELLKKHELLKEALTQKYFA